MLSIKRYIHCVAVVLIVLPVSCSTKSRTIHEGVVNGSTVRIRKAPGVESEIVRTLDINTSVEIIDTVVTSDKQYKDWYKVNVKYSDITGYIFSKLVTPTNGAMLHYIRGTEYYLEYKNNTIAIKTKDSYESIAEIPSAENIARIDGSFISPYILIAGYPSAETSAVYASIMNINTQDVIIEFEPEFLTNPAIHSISPDGKYIAIDTGTSASVRGLTIINIGSAKIVYRTHYIPDEKIWVGNHTLEFYQEDYNCKKELPEPEIVAEGHYIRKLIRWKNGKEKVIADCVTGEN